MFFLPILYFSFFFFFFFTLGTRWDINTTLWSLGGIDNVGGKMIGSFGQRERGKWDWGNKFYRAELLFFFFLAIFFFFFFFSSSLLAL